MAVRFSASDRELRIRQIDDFVRGVGTEHKIPRLTHREMKAIELNAIDDLCLKPERDTTILDAVRDVAEVSKIGQYRRLLRRIDAGASVLGATK